MFYACNHIIVPIYCQYPKEKRHLAFANVSGEKQESLQTNEILLIFK